MKSKICIFVLLLMGILLSSCEKRDIDFENEYEKSHKIWLTFKALSGNTYNYVVTGASWVGIAWETKITVSNGIVTQREFRFTSINGLEENFTEEDLAWIEYENEINSHENSVAAAPLTLDEVYENAKNEWLIKRKNAKTYFEANNEGLISTCGYVEDGWFPSTTGHMRDRCVQAAKVL